MLRLKILLEGTALTQLSYPTEEKRDVASSNSPTLNPHATEADQILHLKRLLVTLKQQYEKTLLGLRERLSIEQERHLESREEVKRTKLQYEEETESLRLQLLHIREMLKTTQDELRRPKEVSEDEKEQMQRSRASLEAQILQLQKMVAGKELLEDKYDQLKEEWFGISEKYEEAAEARLLAEEEAKRLRGAADELQMTLAAQTSSLADREEEKQHLESTLLHLEKVIEEGDAKLKMAQQHLAKKMKESTVLSQQLEEKETVCVQMQQQLHLAQQQTHSLQLSLEQSEQRERRLQEQLQDTVRIGEAQAGKWEEKYFQMCDKWQESEAQLRELKKFEEKYRQMQGLILNLGAFIGSPSCSSEELVKQGETAPATLEADRYDLFGMERLPDKQLPAFYS